jgi:hypothetical protein
MAELLASHSLIFSTSKTEAIVKSLKRDDEDHKEISLEVVKDFRISYSEPSLQLADFPIFGGRLRYLHQRMASWRPLRVRELWKRPYRDPLPFFTFWAGTVIGIFTLVAVILGGLQVTYAILAYYHPLY